MTDQRAGFRRLAGVAYGVGLVALLCMTSAVMAVSAWTWADRGVWWKVIGSVWFGLAALTAAIERTWHGID